MEVYARRPRLAGRPASRGRLASAVCRHFRLHCVGVSDYRLTASAAGGRGCTGLSETRAEGINTRGERW